MEIERKFLLSGFPDLPELERAEVFQGYLGISPEAVSYTHLTLPTNSLV